MLTALTLGQYLRVRAHSTDDFNRWTIRCWRTISSNCWLSASGVQSSSPHPHRKREFARVWCIIHTMQQFENNALLSRSTSAGRIVLSWRQACFETRFNVNCGGNFRTFIDGGSSHGIRLAFSPFPWKQHG